MFITKRALSRRTFLRGVGATVALPLLESMVPAFGRTAQSPPSPPLRFGAVYVPNGAPMKHWMPAATTGAASSSRRSSSRSSRSRDSDDRHRQPVARRRPSRSPITR